MDFKAIKGIIFDYGGTLDTHGHHWVHVLSEGWAASGMRVPEEVFREAYVQGERALAADGAVAHTDCFRDVLLKKTVVALGSIRRPERYYFGAHTFDTDRVAAEIAAYCDSIAAAGAAKSAQVLDSLSRKYPLCLVSNFYGNLHTVLSAYGLARYFTYVIESASVGFRKPDPRIFSLGAEALALPPEQVLVVGDSLDKDIKPAHAIGCLTAWLMGESWDDADEGSGQASCIISSLRQLADSLLNA